MRLGPLLLVAAVLAAKAVAPAVVDAMPTSWAYDLTDTCHWQPRPWAERLGVDPTPGRTPEALRLRFPCEARRGLKSPSPIVNEVLPRWPTRAEFTAWRDTDAGGGALRAEGAAGGLQAGDQR